MSTITKRLIVVPDDALVVRTNDPRCFAGQRFHEITVIGTAPLHENVRELAITGALPGVEPRVIP